MTKNLLNLYFLSYILYIILNYNLSEFMNERYKSNLVWIDLEMTGLNIETEVILEIATIITNNSLEIISNGPNFAIHQPDEALDSMSDWCKKAHTASGLIQAVKNSKITVTQAQEETLEFIKNYSKENESPLCGNSIWNDRAFLKKYMPTIDGYLNYRMIDVSSIKEVINRWYPESKKAHFPKPDNHRAAEDIFYSIEELKHYKTYFFFPD